MDAYFQPTPAGLDPVPEAHSPWATDMLHGRLLAGLAARAVEADEHDAAYAVSRLTVDMFRSPPMLPFTTTTEVIRAGGRVRVLDVVIESGGREIARARALLQRTGDEPGGEIWHAPRWAVPLPDDLPVPDDQGEGPGAGGWEIRLVNEGGFWTAGRKRLWSRDGWALVAGEAMSPVVRAALAADLPNPMANAGSAGLAYINPDLTLFLARPPRSEWIGLEVADHVSAGGLAVGTCTLYDIDGPIGSSTVCAVTNPTSLTPSGE
jgi:hypothetical protein